MPERKTPQILRAVQFKHHAVKMGPRRKAIYTVHVNGVLIASFESTIKTPTKAMNASSKLCEKLIAALAPCDFQDTADHPAIKTRAREHWVKRRFTVTRKPLSELLPLEEDQ